MKAFRKTLPETLPEDPLRSLLSKTPSRPLRTTFSKPFGTSLPEDPFATSFETAFENPLRNQTPPEDPFDSQPATSLAETPFENHLRDVPHRSPPPSKPFGARRVSRNSFGVVPKPCRMPSDSPFRTLRRHL